MKSVTVAKKKKSKTRKPTVPKDIQTAITESLSGHTKLYDAVNQMWRETIKRVYECPNAVYMGYRMHQGIVKSMRSAFSEGVEKAKFRQRKKRNRPVS